MSRQRLGLGFEIPGSGFIKQTVMTKDINHINTSTIYPHRHHHRTSTSTSTIRSWSGQHGQEAVATIPAKR